MKVVAQTRACVARAELYLPVLSARSKRTGRNGSARATHMPLLLPVFSWGTERLQLFYNRARRRAAVNLDPGGSSFHNLTISNTGGSVTLVNHPLTVSNNFSVLGGGQFSVTCGQSTPGNWSPRNSAGNETFVMAVKPDVLGGGYTALVPAGSVLLPAVPRYNSQGFWLQFTSPASTVQTAQQTITVTITARAQ